MIRAAVLAGAAAALLTALVRALGGAPGWTGGVAIVTVSAMAALVVLTLWENARRARR